MANDLKGPIRNWKNWLIQTFTPSGANVAAPSGIITAPYQVNQGLNTLQPQSQLLANHFAHLQNNSAHFEDREFPSNLQSLIGFGERPKEKLDRMRAYTWELPPKTLGTNHFTVAGPPVGPLDLKQGKLGNCYFLSSLAALAEYPERVKRIMRVQQPSPLGIYCVALNVTGLWEDVIIDDKIPYDNSLKMAAFCRSNGHDLWVSLIEKAWAKVHGGYANIESGFLNEALGALTGAPVKTFKVRAENEEECWKQLVESKHKNYITCASTSDIFKNVSETPNEKTGLVGGHAYSLLGAYEVDYRGQKVRLVKMRNPWGKGEWKGDWSDNSPLWTPELRNQLRLTNADDGVFHMTFSDAGKYFSDFAVCHYRDNYVTSAKKFLTSPGLPSVFAFNIQSPGEYYFKVHQISKRAFRKSDMYAYSALTIIIAKEEAGRLVYMGNACRARDQTWVLANCPPGKYYAYITTPWRRETNTLGFSIYGPTIVDFSAVDPANFGPDFIQNMMLDCARKNRAPRKEFSQSGHPEISVLKYQSQGFDEISYYYFDNRSQTHHLKVTVSIKTLQDMEILPPHQAVEGGTTEFIVQPKSDHIFMVRQKGENPKFSNDFHYSFKKVA